MSGLICPVCGGNMEGIISGDGMQCDTCSFIVRSDGSSDRSEMDEAEE